MDKLFIQYVPTNKTWLLDEGRRLTVGRTEHGAAVIYGIDNLPKCGGHGL